MGGLWGLTGKEMPGHWTGPWNGRVAMGLAGLDEVSLQSLVERTMAVAKKILADFGEGGRQ